MKHILSIIFALTLLALTDCNSSSHNSTKSNDIINNHPRDIFIIRPTETNISKIKNYLIEQIQYKVETDLALIKEHETDIIREPAKQLGIQCAIFDEIHYNNVLHKPNATYPIDKNKIKLFYASIDYNIIRLKWLGEILIQIQAPQTKKGNALYKSILNTGREYYQKSFEELINEINTTKNKLNLLNEDQLIDITNNLDTIENLRQIWIGFVDDIINDYRNNAEIQNNNIKLIEHTITKYNKIKDKINDIKDIAHKIKKILKSIKHHYFINKQILSK
ncbi:complement regulator-acquiring protein (plasmid) [Borrelia coriaceae]|uniref:complement regulator-acquiring protein n=1 Tax=Borrelia coriaceae TaxID=144 RepID=UPI00046D6390|nr:complement regulator-acquiring protein [Borrelia coriaceae]UPA16964.1 complement regulator-acquiring protein [Borrelia coriaceae]